jgi:hypothetical protein
MTLVACRSFALPNKRNRNWSARMLMADVGVRDAVRAMGDEGVRKWQLQPAPRRASIRAVIARPSSPLISERGLATRTSPIT